MAVARAPRQRPPPNPRTGPQAEVRSTLRCWAGTTSGEHCAPGAAAAAKVLHCRWPSATVPAGTRRWSHGLNRHGCDRRSPSGQSTWSPRHTWPARPQSWSWQRAGREEGGANNNSKKEEVEIAPPPPRRLGEHAANRAAATEGAQSSGKERLPAAGRAGAHGASGAHSDRGLEREGGHLAGEGRGAGVFEERWVSGVGMCRVAGCAEWRSEAAQACKGGLRVGCAAPACLPPPAETCSDGIILSSHLISFTGHPMTHLMQCIASPHKK